MRTDVMGMQQLMRIFCVIVFVLLLLLVSTTPTSAEVGDALMSGGYKSVTAGGSWYLSEGYILKVEEVSVAREQVWVTIWKHGEMVDSQVVHVDETFAYETEIGGDEYTILRTTVETIKTISSNTIVTFKSVYQYSDGSNDPVATPTTVSANATPTPTEDGGEGNLVEYDLPVIATGGSFNLRDGYALSAPQIDTESNRAWLTLSKDGKEIGSKVLDIGETYSYTADDGHLLMEAEMKGAFRSTDTNMVQLAWIRQYQVSGGAVRFTPTPTPAHASTTARRATTNERADTSTDRAEVEERVETAAPNKGHQIAEAAKGAALKQYGTIAAALVVAVIGLSTTSKYRSKQKESARKSAQSAISGASSNPGCTSKTRLGSANSAFQSEKYSEALTLAQEAMALHSDEKKLFNRLDGMDNSVTPSGTINAIKSEIRSAKFGEADRMIKEALAKNEFDEHERKVRKAEQSIEEAKNKGVEVPPVVSDLLDKVKGALENHEYQKIGETTAAILTKVGDATEKHDQQRRAKDEINAAKRELTRIEEIGVPSAEFREMLDRAEDACEKGDHHDSYNIAKECINRSKEKADEHAKAKNEVESAKRELTRIEEIGIPSAELREILNKAESAFNDENYRNAAVLATECISRVNGQADKHAKARSEIESARRELDRIAIVESLMQELNEQLKGAGDAFRNDEYDKAYTLANGCISDATSINNKRKKSEDKLNTAKQRLEKKEALGIPMHDLNGRLAEAGEAYQRGSYDDALQHAHGCISAAEEATDLYKPEIAIAFPEDMQYNVWRRMKLVLENTGTMHAKNVRLDIKKAFEIRNLDAVPVIEAGTQVELEVIMRPTESGDVPVDYALEFTDPLDRGYKLEDTQWLKVLTEARYSAGTDEGYSTQYGGKVEIRRGYEVLGNNDLRFGIRVINDTGFTIIDVQTILDYPNTLFSLRGDVVQNIGNIGPGGKRTARYELTPLGCVHQEKLNAIVAYQDHTGKKRTVQMTPKEVHCVCPFLRESAITEGEFAELAAASKYIEEGLSFSGIGVSEIADFVKESCSHRLYLIGEHEHEGGVILSLAGESIGEKAYYLLTAVVGEYEGVTQVALRAYSDKTHGLRGFLNEMTGSLRQLVGSVQSAREIGVIEKKQVINIIDSVVQRTSFSGGGDVEVNVKGSVVQRSNVGSRACPNCGAKVQEGAEFCTECGDRVDVRSGHE